MGIDEETENTKSVKRTHSNYFANGKGVPFRELVN
jgi:hypothetical protein